MKLTTAILAAFCALLTTIFVAAGCGANKAGSGFDDGDKSGDGGGVLGDGGKGFGGGDGGDAGPGPKLDCSNSGTVTGTVYAPNGTLPLYNVIVFTPSTALTPFTEGVSCDKCGTVSGNPLSSTVSDASGKFTLQVPAGDNVPLVFQVGKWRREVKIPHVELGCSTPLVLSDPNLTRLPKNSTEGDIPHMAVTTGTCDSIACVLPKMGIDASEFGSQSEYASKRVIMYQGVGPAAVSGITPAQNLWGNASEISKYDVAIFSCECSEAPSSKTPADEAVVANYLNAGGRTFGTDFMYTWIHQGTSFTGSPPPPISNIMQGFVGGAPGDSSGLYNIDTSFAKGQALSDWLLSVGGSTTKDKVQLTSVFKNFKTADPTLAQRWVYGNTDKAISFTTPFSEPNEADRCGKSFFMDIHVGSGGVDSGFPSSCGTTLSPQEKMMVFFMFDLASCIQDDTQPVNPPR